MYSSKSVSSSWSRDSSDVIASFWLTTSINYYLAANLKLLGQAIGGLFYISYTDDCKESISWIYGLGYKEYSSLVYYIGLTLITFYVDYLNFNLVIYSELILHKFKAPTGDDYTNYLKLFLL